MATSTTVTKDGITFTFSAAREVGQFANGDWWAQGPLTITSITPDFSSGSNGWQVNPPVQATQGFSSAHASSYDAGLMPSLPYTTSGDCSIVKAISGNVDFSYVVTAAVLTVLESIPAGGGAGYFRPPYVGTSKPLYAVTDIDTDLIPSIPAVGTPATLASVASYYSSKCLRMDHITTAPRTVRPSSAGTDYQPDIIKEVTDHIIRLMLDDDITSKQQALIYVTQYCIDQAYAVLGGYRHGSLGGHNPGHRLTAGWAAVLLNITSVLDVLASEAETAFHEDRYVTKLGSVALWGESSSETQYWNYINSQEEPDGPNGSQSNRDPYGYVDGGFLTADVGNNWYGAAYQLIVSQNMKGIALALHLMPELQASFRVSQWPLYVEYTDRFVDHGIWTIPDIAAPYTNDAGYGTDYGPSPVDAGPILGSGRWPELHGAGPDSGMKRSTFVAAMWDAYRDGVPDPVPPTAGNSVSRRILFR